MWLWLQKKLKITLRDFFKRILLISLLVHVILLFYCFFVFKDKVLNLNIFLNKKLIENSPVPIVFLPFAKTVPGSIEKLKKMSRNEKPNILIKKNMVQKEKIVKPKPTPVLQKSKLDKKKSIIIEKKNTKADKSVQTPKVIEKKVEQTNELPKEEQKPINQEKKIVENNVTNDSGAIYLGRDDIESQKLNNLVHNEIIKYWKPPKGLPKNLECSVKIKIDNNGKVINLIFEKSSKVLMYDLTLKNALLKTVMPNELKDKEFVLNLNS